MYRKIIVPVDLAHADKLRKALDVSADLGKHYGASVRYVGVTTALPSSVAHTIEEFAEKLERFAADESRKHGLSIDTEVAESHDPVRDLDDVLGKVIKENGADLVVMASHVPTFLDHVFASNAGYLASHVAVSVFIVR